jgi:hypothetical protein
MSGSSQTTAFRPRASAPDVSVRSWPLVEGDRTAWLMLTFLLAVLFLVSMLTQSLPTGIALAALLGLAMWQLWLPTTYDVSVAGISQRSLGRARRIAWKEIATCEPRQGGVLLRLAGAEPAMYVPFHRHKADILAHLEEGLSPRR